MLDTLTTSNFNFSYQESVYHCKVRDVYYSKNNLVVMVASDRISAFDYILPKGIPFKGQVLNQLAEKFLRATSDIVPNFIEGKLGYYALANETSISEGTVEGAYEAVKVVLTATEMLENEKSLFALCRPPGHHASKDQYGGYCFFNNVAIAAERLIEKGAKKIFILDVDFHHGNGTQAIFYDRPDVYFASLHGDPKEAFPHFLGHANEKGYGAGEGYNINYPMQPGTPYEEWTRALDDVIEKIESYQPDALLISLGVDTYEKDPISFFKLKSDDFFDVGKKIASCGLPTLFVMEGGYAIKEIGINTVNVLKGFEGSSS